MKIKSIEWNDGSLVSDHTYKSEIIDNLNADLSKVDDIDGTYHLIVGITELNPDGDQWSATYFIALQNRDHYATIEIHGVEFDGIVNWDDIGNIIYQNIYQLT